MFLCLRLVIQPTNILEELRDRINQIALIQSQKHQTQIKEVKPATCRRVKRGVNIAQSFSMGTVARPRINRRSVRLGGDDGSKEDSNRYSDHIKVVDAFDEILSELETVRITLPTKEPTSPTARIRPSSIKQRPFSTFVAKSNFEEEKESVRDSGYMSQHNSQSSVASSSTVDDDEEDEESVETEEMIFALIDYWSLNFTGDLHYPDTLHLVMEILEKLRQKNKVSVFEFMQLLFVYHTLARNLAPQNEKNQTHTLTYVGT